MQKEKRWHAGVMIRSEEREIEENVSNATGLTERNREERERSES